MVNDIFLSLSSVLTLEAATRVGHLGHIVNMDYIFNVIFSTPE